MSVKIDLRKLGNMYFNYNKYAIYDNQLIINRFSLQSYDLPHLHIQELNNPNYLKTLDFQDLLELLIKQIVA